jgi:hypothetical protein
VHHVQHYEDGGPTAVANGILLCPRHHTAVHEGGFRITGEPNGVLTFHRPDGSIVGTSGAFDQRPPVAAGRHAGSRSQVEPSVSGRCPDPSAFINQMPQWSPDCKRE